MLFLSLRAFARLVAVTAALHFSSVVQGQGAGLDSGGVRYIEIADAGGSEGPSDQGMGAADSDSSDDGAESEDSKDDQQFDPDGSRHSGSDDRFDGPNGALKAVQANRAVPLDGIVATTRHLTDGQIIDTRLHTVKGVLLYELKVLETNNEVRRYSFNARTGQLIKVR